MDNFLGIEPKPTKWPEVLPRAGNQLFRRLDSVSSWFEIYQMTEDTFAFLEPNHNEEVLSYLLLGSKQALLIDSGMGIGNLRAEISKLTDMPVILVNTHSHFDHIGDNYRFQDIWAYDEQSEIERLQSGYTHMEVSRSIARTSYTELPQGFDPTTYRIRPAPVTRRLKHLETIELGNRTLTVHHTPGHSPGSICLLEQPYQLLFTGDTIYPGTLAVHLEGSDFQTYQNSLEYLMGLWRHVNFLCPGHNEAYTPKEMLRLVLNAFKGIANGQFEYDLQSGTRLYHFEGFDIRTPLEI